MLYDEIEEALRSEVPSSEDVELLEKISELKKLLFAAWLKPVELLNQRENKRLEYVMEEIENMKEVPVEELTVEMLERYNPRLLEEIRGTTNNSENEVNLDDELSENIISAAKSSVIFG